MKMKDMSNKAKGACTPNKWHFVGVPMCVYARAEEFSTKTQKQNKLENGNVDGQKLWQDIRHIFISPKRSAHTAKKVRKFMSQKKNE